MNCLCQEAERQALDRNFQYCAWRKCGQPDIEYMTKLCGQCDQATQKEQADRQEYIKLVGGDSGYNYDRGGGIS